MSDVNKDGWLTDGATDPDDVRAFYDRWAARYDDDLAGWDYRAPRRIAKLLAEHADLAAPVLDAGCGTGLSGRALRAVGFSGYLTGIDLSEASLPVAEASRAYQRLQAANLNRRLEFEDDSFGAVACVGVLTYVPNVEAIWREFCRVTRPGGVVAFTQRQDTWVERSCQAVLDLLVDEGVWTVLVATEPEAYLPDTGDELGQIGAHYVAVRVN